MFKKIVWFFTILYIFNTNAFADDVAQKAIQQAQMEAKKAISEYSADDSKKQKQSQQKKDSNLFDYKSEDDPLNYDNEGGQNTNAKLIGLPTDDRVTEIPNAVKSNPQSKDDPASYPARSIELEEFQYIVPDGAKTLDMTSEINIAFVKGKQSVVILPFIITDYKIDNFQRRSTESRAEADSVDIEVKNNQIIFKSTNSGKIDMTVEGGPYPVILHIYFNLKTGAQYIAILDSLKGEREKAGSPYNLQADNHTENLVAITDALYSNKKIVGFKEIDEKQVYEIPEYGLNLIKSKSIAGNGYLGEVWFITNTGERALIISEEMFYEEGVYSVSILNDVIDPNKSSKIFVIRKLNAQ